MNQLRLLLSLSLTQRRRDFSWKSLFVGAYFTLLFVGMVVALYVELRDQLKAASIPFELPAVALLMAVSAIPGDLIMKLLWRRSPVEMDDSLRSRPVEARVWARFIFIDTSAGFLQWVLPLILTFIGALVLPAWVAALVLVLTFSCTLTNALFQNCWRRAPGNQYTLPLVFGYLFWMFLAYVVAVACFIVVGLAGDDPSTPVLPRAVTLGTLAFALLLLALNALAQYVLHSYFCRLHNHNEEEHAPVATTARSLGEVSLWSIEWVQILRSKRLRVSVLTIAVIFLLNTYMQQNPQVQKDFGGVNLMLLFGIAFPSIILAQWVLGIEANFFAGIWSRPWPVEDILRRKYALFCALCGLMALLILPCVVWMGMSFWMWLSTLLFGCGVFVLPFMATCLFSSRMDLFSSAFFNYQGGNKQINVFSFVMFIPMGIYYAAYFLLPTLWAHVLVGGLGILGLALHRAYIHWIAGIWHRRRYKIMERWLTE